MSILSCPSILGLGLVTRRQRSALVWRECHHPTLTIKAAQQQQVGWESVAGKQAECLPVRAAPASCPLRKVMAVPLGSWGSPIPEHTGSLTSVLRSAWVIAMC